MIKNKLLTRRYALWLSLGVLTGIGTCAKSKPIEQSQNAQAIGNFTRDFTVMGEVPLKERAVAKGLIYGAFPDDGYNIFFKDTQLQSSFNQECGLLAAYFGTSIVHPQENRFDFTATDYFAKFASDNRLLFRGVPLVWKQYNAEWLEKKVQDSNTTSKEIESILVNHISTIVRRYGGQVHSWDVVNEAVMAGSWNPRDDQLDTGSPWFRFLGDNYIDLAFRVAAESDPNALLVYNDNAVEYDTPEEEVRRNAMLKLLERLKSKGTPIHAFGIQGHLDGQRNHLFNPPKFRKFLSDVASLGLKILITELDVSDKDLPQDINTRDRIVAEAYEDFLSVALDEPAVIAVINWGLSDRDSWLSWYSPRQDGLPVRPLPLDERLNRKLGWNAMARAFDNAPRR
jgi:endo-1,4-beta-xylanase